VQSHRRRDCARPVYDQRLGPGVTAWIREEVGEEFRGNEWAITRKRKAEVDNG
jgi:hypothetical protein